MFPPGSLIAVDLAANDQALADGQLVRVPNLDRNTAALAGGGAPDEDEDRLVIDVEEPFGLQAGRAAPRAAIGPPQEVVDTANDRGVGVEARHVELNFRGKEMQGSGHAFLRVFQFHEDFVKRALEFL